MRLIIAQAIDHPNKPIRRVPVGTKAAWDPALHRRGTQILLARSDGSQERATIVNHNSERVTHDGSWTMARARASHAASASQAAS